MGRVGKTANIDYLQFIDKAASPSVAGRIQRNGTVLITYDTTVKSLETNYQEFTSNGTWTKPVGITTVKVQVIGAGGGGATGTAGIGGGISGGNGGGIVILISKNLTITGGISVNGGGLYQDRINGGGGAGGSILLKGQTLVLGTNLTTAIGGVLVGSPEDPGDGGVGRIHADYSTSISGTTNPTIDTTIDSIYVDPPTVENLNQVNFGGFVEF